MPRAARFPIPLSIRTCGFPAYGLPMMFLTWLRETAGGAPMLRRSYATGSDPGGAVLTGGALFMPVIEDDVLTRNRELTIRKDHSKAGSDVLSHGSHATLGVFRERYRSARNPSTRPQTTGWAQRGGCPQLKPPRRLRLAKRGRRLRSGVPVMSWLAGADPRVGVRRRRPRAAWPGRRARRGGR